MNIDLTKYFEEYIAQLINSGRFNDASEVVRAGLRALEQQEASYDARLEALRAEIRQGYEGNPVPFDLAEIKQKGREVKPQREQLQIPHGKI